MLRLLFGELVNVLYFGCWMMIIFGVSFLDVLMYFKKLNVIGLFLFVMIVKEFCKF